MKDIIDIGFSSMIGMASEEIPGKIAHFVVDNFDVDSMKLKLSNSVISITPELVYKILGVPLGGEDINRMNRLGTEDVTTLEWHGQFSKCSHGVEELDNDFINQTNKENGEDSLEEMIEEVNQKIIEADIVLQKSINDDVQSKEY
nr:ulp1 protease family, C-terminal catalytic domain-containing protein [Tanacetum cinerariifolium]